MPNDTSNCLVTIITSYYNDQDFLVDAIKSVLAQSYSNWEYILINHASTDKSRSIAHSFKDPRIKHIDLTKNYGASGNLLVKKGLEKAHGTYIKLHCADDILYPTALNTLVQTALKNKADLVFGNVQFVDRHQKSLNKTWFTHRFPANLPPENYIRSLLKGISCFPYAGNLIKKTAFDKIPLDYVCVNLADMELWACMLLTQAKLAFTNECVCSYRMHDKNLCSARQADIIHRRNLFEHLLFMQTLLNTAPSVELLKKIFPTDSLSRKLTSEDQSLVPFVMAYALSKDSPLPVFRQAIRLKMAQMLNDYTLQQQIEHKFGYSIKDLRNSVLKTPLQTIPANELLSQYQDIKAARLYTLGYFFFRKFFHILLLRDYRQYRRKKRLAKNTNEVI
ncbi:MAG: glycosyltransferase [Elusimicrobiaceae bacterium]|nr:glycosyltransferase [Elusimicrobiaceae bacterium]